MPTRRHTSATRAFTLVELLVTFGVIALLLAIALPSIAEIRRSAVRTKCAAGLHSIATAYAGYASDHSDFYPIYDYTRDRNGIVLEPALVEEWGVGGGGWLVDPTTEMLFWGYLLRPYLSDDHRRYVLATVEALSCPTVFRRWEESLPVEQLTNGILDPMQSPQRSYVASLGSFTSPSGWSQSDSVPDLRQISAGVRVSQTTYPSSKALMTERHSNHGDDNSPLIDDEFGSLNILASDGHTESLDSGAAKPWNPFEADSFNSRRARLPVRRWRELGVPFVSTSGGASGRDW